MPPAPPVISYIISSRRALTCSRGVINIETTGEDMQLIGSTGRLEIIVAMNDRAGYDAMLVYLDCSWDKEAPTSPTAKTVLMISKKT